MNTIPFTDWNSNLFSMIMPPRVKYDLSIISSCPVFPLNPAEILGGLRLSGAAVVKP